MTYRPAPARSDALDKVRKERSALSRTYRVLRKGWERRTLACREGPQLQKLLTWAATLRFAELDQIGVVVARAAWLLAASPNLQFLALSELDRTIIRARERVGLLPFDDPLEGEDVFRVIRRLLTPKPRKTSMFTVTIQCHDAEQLSRLSAFLKNGFHEPLVNYEPATVDGGRGCLNAAEPSAAPPETATVDEALAAVTDMTKRLQATKGKTPADIAKVVRRVWAESGVSKAADLASKTPVELGTIVRAAQAVT